MKFADRIKSLIIVFGLWMLIAFVAGIVLRPIANAFLYGFHIWDN